MKWYPVFILTTYKIFGLQQVAIDYDYYNDCMKHFTRDKKKFFGQQYNFVFETLTERVCLLLVERPLGWLREEESLGHVVHHLL